MEIFENLKGTNTFLTLQSHEDLCDDHIEIKRLNQLLTLNADNKFDKNSDYKFSKILHTLTKENYFRDFFIGRTKSVLKFYFRLTDALWR